MFRFAPARRREAETVDPPLTDLTAGVKVVLVGGLGCNSSTTTRSRVVFYSCYDDEYNNNMYRRSNNNN